MIRLLMISAIALAVFSCVYGENELSATEKRTAPKQAAEPALLNGAAASAGKATDK